MNIGNSTIMKHGGAAYLSHTGGVGKTHTERKVSGDANLRGLQVSVAAAGLDAAKDFGNLPAGQLLARLHEMESSVLEAMMIDHFKALSAVVENLKPSDEQEAQLKKRDEELRKMLDELKDLIKAVKEEDLARDQQEARFAQILTHNDLWEAVWGPVAVPMMV